MLFDIPNVPGNKLLLDNCYVNGLYALRQITIQSTCDQALRFKLKANSGAIAFQLSNENLSGLSIPPLLVTNTVEASALNLNEFNQVFNTVNHVDELYLLPHASQTIVLVFLPTENLSKRRSEENLLLSEENEIFSFFEVHAQLFFFAYFQTEKEEENRVPDAQITIKFKARVCRSYLWTDAGELGFHFEDCIAGGTYLKDFTVWNRSEIDLFWNLKLINGSHKHTLSWISFTDYHTGEPLECKPIPAFSHKRIRLTFKPLDIGEFHYEFEIENLNDASNIIEIPLHMNVRSVPVEETLVILNGNVIDFGDCCAGTWTRQALVLRNVSESVMDIYFSSDSGLVMFQLAQSENFHPASPMQVTPQRPAKTRDRSLTELSIMSESSLPSSSRGSIASSPIFTRKTSEYHSDVDILDLLRRHSSSSLNLSIEEDLESPHPIPEYARIEELVLRPGSDKTIDVLYQPEKEPWTADGRSARLTRKTFKMIINYEDSAKKTEKKVIQCRSKACTSFIEINPKIVDFGDSDVGTLKSSSIKITNLSDLPAKIELRFISKVLSAPREELQIPPNQSIDVKIDILPRKVNPDYRKQITVVNLLNRDNDQVVDVRATNIDKHGVTFHSLFYRILTSKTTNYIDFGNVVVNSPAIRTFTVENISKKALKLNVSTSQPLQIKLFTRGRDKKPLPLEVEQSIARKEKLLESIADKRRIVSKSGSERNVLPTLPKVENENISEYLDLASSGIKEGRKGTLKRLLTKKSEEKASPIESPALTDIPKTEKQVGLSQLFEIQTINQDFLLNLMETSSDMISSVLLKASSEEKCVRTHILLHRELNNMINDGRLNPVNDTLFLEPKTSVMIVLVYIPTLGEQEYLPLKPRKQDHKLFFNLVDFDRDLRYSEFDQLLQGQEPMPIRELILRSSVCRSVLELGQKNINFGAMDQNERRTKTIVVRNSSEWPLLYAIRKSGSIASGDLLLSDGRLGVIRAYGRREVEFVFEPSLAGPYQEKLLVENILDRTNNQEVIIKANIKKPANFFLQSQSLNFGACLLGQTCPTPQTILICNTSYKSNRTFEVKVDSQELLFGRFQMDVVFEVMEDVPEEDPSKRKKRPLMLLSKEVEEEIERVEQKIKIAERKARKDKVKHLISRLEKLRMGIIADDFDENVDSTSEDSSIAVRPKRCRSILTLSLEPREIRKVLVYIKANPVDLPIRRTLKDAGFEYFSANIHVNEAKNTDMMKKVIFQGILYYNASLFKEHISFQKQKKSPTLANAPLKDDVFEEIIVEKVPAIKESKMEILMTDIDLGKVELKTTRECYFTIGNQGDRPASFMIAIKDRSSVADIRLPPIQKPLSPGETRKVYLSFVPKDHGFYSFHLVVRSWKNDFTVKFSYFGVYSVYLSCGHDGLNSDLDFGHCYIDYTKKYSHVQSYPIQNKTDQVLNVSASSNLTQQCFVFGDKELTLPVEDVLVMPGEKKLFWIVLQPYSASQKTIKTPLIGEEHGPESRSLVGGIRFQISTSQKYLLTTQTIKFTCWVGMSLFAVSTHLIDLGYVSSNQVQIRELTLQNLSGLMPCHYRIDYNSKYIFCSPKKGRLTGWEETKSSHQSITLRISPTVKPGLHRQFVDVYNENNQAQKLSLEVRYMVDDPRVKVDKIDRNRVESIGVTHWINWEDVYMEKDEAWRPVHSCEKTIELENISPSKITLALLSEYHMETKWVGMEPLNDDLTKTSSEGMSYIGKPVRLLPKARVTLQLSPPTFNDWTEAQLQQLNAGKKVLLQGSLFLQDINSLSIVKTFKYNVHVCISKGSVDPQCIDLGKVGYNDSWKEVPFTFKVSNLSENYFHGALDLPDCVELCKFNNVNAEFSRFKLDPLKSGVFQVVLKPRKIRHSNEPGKFHISIVIQNLYNPENRLEIAIVATLTLFVLKFDRLVDGELVIPPVHHPVLPSHSFSDSWFTIVNPTADPVKFRVSFVLTPEIQEFLTIELLSRFSNASLLEPVIINPQSTLDIRAKCLAKESVRLPNVKLFSSSGLILGAIQIIPQKDNETLASEDIPIRGILVEDQIFSVAPKMIEFLMPFTEYKKVLTLCNLSSYLECRLQLKIEYPLEVGSGRNILELPVKEISLSPNTVHDISVELIDLETRELSEDIKIIVIDLDSAKNYSETLSVRIKESERETTSHTELQSIVSSHASSWNSLSGLNTSFSKAFLSTFQLKGCKQSRVVLEGDLVESGGLFELDMGQQDFGGLLITKKLILENNSTEKIDFTVKMLGPEDYHWLSLNKTEGTLEQTQSLVLTFNTNVRGLFSSYLIVENKSNPLDMKIVHVTIDVVSRHNVKKVSSTLSSNIPEEANEQVFEVKTGTGDTVHLNHMFFGGEYSGRSIVVYNRESLPLELSIKSSLRPEDGSILAFSLSRTSLKLFSTAIIEPENNLRIYFYFKPISMDPSPLTLEQADIIQTLNMEVQLNSRLVKDFQKIIHLNAYCRYPQIRLAQNELVFQGTIQTNGDEFTILKDCQTIELENLLRDPLKYDILNSSMYVDVTSNHGGEKRHRYDFLTLADGSNVYPELVSGELEGKGRRLLKISLRRDEIMANLSTLRKDRFILDHLIIYNRERPHEKQFIQIKITFGLSFAIQIASGTKKSVEMIEKQIVALVKDVYRSEITGQLKQNWDYLYFRFLYIVDQLIYYGTREHSGNAYLQLANLLFGLLYMPIVVTVLNDTQRMAWTALLNYFLEFFPVDHPWILQLRRLKVV